VKKTKADDWVQLEHTRVI